MCLNLRKDFKSPYNNDNIRWKIALINPCQAPDLPLKQLVSYYRGYMYDLGKWIKAFNQQDIKEYNKELCEPAHAFQDWRRMFGYHVFLTKIGARRRLSRPHHYQSVLMKVEVKGFVASGMFNKVKSETYRYMRVVEVLDCKGKTIWSLNKK